jgi:hypothetical protein
VESIFNKSFKNKHDSASVGYSNLFTKPIGKGVHFVRKVHLAKFL